MKLLPSVALLAEGVDRNFQERFASISMQRVALLAEGVDRNLVEVVLVDGAGVALLAEGVDRNIVWARTCWRFGRSPSSRRAWIEILHPAPANP